jgi:hypothetical protein
MVPLIVVLGAGASAASAPYGPQHALRPPLTVDLFREDAYQAVLALYDLAHQAGRQITQELADDGALALERALRDLRVSEFPHHQHMAVAVPPYLQHLLHAVSEAHYTEAYRYDRLIEQLLRLPYVYFMTLNYDVLLDRRLNGHHRLSTFDDYISRDKNWSLLKLHGSVNWYHETSEPFDPRLPPRTLSWSSSLECVAPNATLEAIRSASVGANTARYPALALPEGPEDRLLLPPTHAQFVQQTLSVLPEADLLLIGYSGLDKKVLSLLEGAKVKFRRMTVVGRDRDDAVVVHTRLHDAGISAIWPTAFDGDFGSWVDGGGLKELVVDYGGPYPR